MNLRQSINNGLASMVLAGALFAGNVYAGEYHIKWGDTLSGIAKRNGYNVKSIIALNPKLADSNEIYEGQKINVPWETSSNNSSTNNVVHPQNDKNKVVTNNVTNKLRKNVKELNTSEYMISKIKELEGFSPTPYSDGPKKAIGYGHQISPNENYTTITREQADERLRKDIAEREKELEDRIYVPLTQGEFDALLSLRYNSIPLTFDNSRLLKKVNAKDYEGAAKEFDDWVKGRNSKNESIVMPGLVKRRAIEKERYLSSSK